MTPAEFYGLDGWEIAPAPERKWSSVHPRVDQAALAHMLGVPAAAIDEVRLALRESPPGSPYRELRAALRRSTSAPSDMPASVRILIPHARSAVRHWRFGFLLERASVSWAPGADVAELRSFDGTRLAEFPNSFDSLTTGDTEGALVLRFDDLSHALLCAGHGTHLPLSGQYLSSQIFGDGFVGLEFNRSWELWRLEDDVRLARVERGERPPFSRHGRAFLLASEDGTVPAPVPASALLDPEPVPDLTFAGERLALETEEGLVRVRSLESGDVLFATEGELLWSAADGNVLVRRDGRAELRSFPGFELVGSLPPATVAFQLSPAGGRALAALEDGSVVLHELDGPTTTLGAAPLQFGFLTADRILAMEGWRPWEHGSGRLLDAAGTQVAELPPGRPLEIVATEQGVPASFTRMDANEWPVASFVSRSGLLAWERADGERLLLDWVDPASGEILSTDDVPRRVDWIVESPGGSLLQPAYGPLRAAGSADGPLRLRRADGSLAELHGSAPDFDWELAPNGDASLIVGIAPNAPPRVHAADDLRALFSGAAGHGPLVAWSVDAREGFAFAYDDGFVELFLSDGARTVSWQGPRGAQSVEWLSDHDRVAVYYDGHVEFRDLGGALDASVEGGDVTLSSSPAGIRVQRGMERAAAWHLGTVRARARLALRGWRRRRTRRPAERSASAHGLGRARGGRRRPGPLLRGAPLRLRRLGAPRARRRPLAPHGLRHRGLLHRGIERPPPHQTDRRHVRALVVATRGGAAGQDGRVPVGSRGGRGLARPAPRARAGRRGLDRPRRPGAGLPLAGLDRPPGPRGARRVAARVAPLERGGRGESPRRGGPDPRPAVSAPRARQNPTV